MVYGSFCAGEFQLRLPGHQHYNLYGTLLLPPIISNSLQTQLLQPFKPNMISAHTRRERKQKIPFLFEREREKIKIPQWLLMFNPVE